MNQFPPGYLISKAMNGGDRRRHRVGKVPDHGSVIHRAAERTFLPDVSHGASCTLAARLSYVRGGPPRKSGRCAGARLRRNRTGCRRVLIGSVGALRALFLRRQPGAAPVLAQYCAQGRAHEVQGLGYENALSLECLIHGCAVFRW